MNPRAEDLLQTRGATKMARHSSQGLGQDSITLCAMAQGTTGHKSVRESTDPLGYAATNRRIGPPGSAATKGVEIYRDAYWRRRRAGAMCIGDEGGHMRERKRIGHIGKPSSVTMLRIIDG
jgi:hypothetical protein